MLPQFAAEELAAALDAAVADLFKRAGVEQPPVDAVALAKRLGFMLAWDDRQSNRARLVRLAGQPDCGGLSILLKPDPRPERRQWAVAHEIGEYLSPQVFDALAVDPGAAPLVAREKIANLLASRLLLPTDWFAADAAADGWDLLELKQRYHTASHELIARRMLDFSAPVVISIIDQGRLEFRRSNVPGRVPPLCPLERNCWQCVHTQKIPIGPLDSGATSVRGWPIHEPDWRREILRLELSDESGLE
ncbi:MAG TPA: ImmA/IrrE family metallo-endopeptidase [Pirellulales bacterium]|nr:ImmA/IrrE family metallo-endopeptidase [Pirellulales bacterium]